jgi:hypothetical protein
MFEPKRSCDAIEAAMCELAPVRRTGGMPFELSWAATLIALMFGLSALAVFDAYDGSRADRPGEATLAANFFAHEAAFDELARMLAVDRRSLAAQDTGAIDIATLARLDHSAPRLAMYGRLLRQISVVDLRYFPASGKLILVPDGEESPQRPSQSYVYLPHAQPESFVQHHGYYLDGPGMDIVTRDRRLKSSWFIRREITIEVAVTPY